MNILLFQKIETLGLATRVVAALRSADIQYVGELVQKKRTELRLVKGLERVAFGTIERPLSKLGLTLEMRVEWSRPQVAVSPPQKPPWFYQTERKPQQPQHCHPQSHAWISSSGSRCSICGRALDGTPPPPARPARTILGWQRLAHAVATSKGFYEKRPLNFGEQITLMHCELSEVFEEFRKGKGPTEIYYREDGKPEGIPIEFADVILRVMQWSQELGIDLEAAMLEKTAFNETREYMHGKKV